MNQSETPVMSEETVEPVAEAAVPEADNLTEIDVPPAPEPEPPADAADNISLLSGVEVTATVELGQTRMLLRDVLKLHRGSVIELDKLVGQPADLLINNIVVARGEIIVLNERFGFRVSKFVSPTEV